MEDMIQGGNGKRGQGEWDLILRMMRDLKKRRGTQGQDEYIFLYTEYRELVVEIRQPLNQGI